MVHYIVLAVVAVFGLTALGAPVCVQAEEAISDLRALAEDGDASAQSELGGMYLYGRGVAQDDAEAVRWFRLAADQGDASAQAKLGGMYLYGLGVAQDEAEAFRWCRRAADQGDASAGMESATHCHLPRAGLSRSLQKSSYKPYTRTDLDLSLGPSAVRADPVRSRMEGELIMVHYIVLAVVAVFGLTALGAPVCVQAEEAISDLRALAEWRCFSTVRARRHVLVRPGCGTG